MHACTTNLKNSLHDTLSERMAWSRLFGSTEQEAAGNDRPNLESKQRKTPGENERTGVKDRSNFFL
jgi:hypothetical protein